MATGEKSLRTLVEHWLAPGAGHPVRVAEFRNRRSGNACYVRVETSTSAGHAAMFFFRHRDGIWRVFPPDRERPCMSCQGSGSLIE